MYRSFDILDCVILALFAAGVISLLVFLFRPESVTPQPSVVEINQAVTTYFETRNWIFDVYVKQAAEPYYVISTDEGTYKVVLSEDKTKVIKAVKE
ncbi:hypothetical protein [Brevibacillus laterosporus]|uniref:hypothetical protein n=1 Tax=Brevibacillus laterosporus TaxID=1465 RepID=UPI003D222E90